jgi:hypothetical protein
MAGLDGGFMKTTGMRRGIAMAMGAAVLTGAAGLAPAQDTPTYKCYSRGQVVYSQLPCNGGKEVGSATARKTDKHTPPPQDRAKIARRAQLTPEAREECRALEVRIKEQDTEFKAMGPTATVQDETPLVKSKLRFNELKC